MTDMHSPNIHTNMGIVNNSLEMANSHYENFPVASVFLPQYLREPIGLIYSFARQADDFADEGDLNIEQRIDLLNGFRNELELLQAYIKPKSSFFNALGAMIKAKKLPFEPFYDLLNAFSQDVTKTRYADYDEVLDYCTRSANPIGRLLLHLYGQSNPNNIKLSDNICTALQIINFIQDIAIDFKKNDGKQRIYLCQDEMAAFNITESQIQDFVDGTQEIDENWQQFILFNLHRVNALLYSGKPLGRILTGRIGFEMRMIIAGGERIIAKINKVNGDIFNFRPTLNYGDWLIVFFKALMKV
ncbi:MAG: squalene synthase HpnC [Methylotenera sp.]|uniref:squalene synthase HpnC n=1 Tax=Methylotenera sp. TaxID=2051956 RepID=UPI00248723A7|nr:squalene synthase HpnC [Methylotenera sp.]MDI1309444.1 squalene synthase HpnC [Methylotenera sp.]